MKNNSPVLILCAVAAIGLITPLHALTVTVVPFRGFEGSHLDIGTALLQAELQDAGTVTVRDRNAVPELIASLERCQSGLMQCSEATAGLQRVDVMVFGEIQRRGEDEYVVSVRAVSERTWTVIYSGSQTSDDYEEVLEDLADDMNDSFRVLAASVISYLSYFVILVAFSRGAGAAETAAVRQVSIPVSVLLAVIVLGETRLAHRLGWASLIAAGIILIVIGDKLL